MNARTLHFRTLQSIFYLHKNSPFFLLVYNNLALCVFALCGACLSLQIYRKVRGLCVLVRGSTIAQIINNLYIYFFFIDPNVDVAFLFYLITINFLKIIEIAKISINIMILQYLYQLITLRQRPQNIMT